MQEILALNKAVFERLHEEGVRYCHWKSNQHLDASFAGDTDFDLLIWEEQFELFSEVLASLGIQRFETVCHRDYPFVHDFVGLDSSTGKIIHYHVHTKLILGEQFYKSVVLPWDEILLSERIWNENFEIYHTDYSLELILLLIRIGQKIRWRTLLTGRAAIPSHIADEIDWLRQRVDVEDVLSRCQELTNAKLIEFLSRLLHEGRESIDLYRLKKATDELCAPYRRESSSMVRCGFRWGRELMDLLIYRIGQRRLKTVRWLPGRRRTEDQGVVIAIIGCDGSGKTTVSREVTKRLREKLDVQRIYLGTGKESMFGRILQFVMGSWKKYKSRAEAQQSSGGLIAADFRNEQSTASKGFSRRWLRLPWAIGIMVERAAKLPKICIAKKSGVVTVTDRFPQNEVKGFNDGPILLDDDGELYGPLRGAQKLEERLYEWFSELRLADTVIVLDVSPDEAQKRRPEMSKSQLVRKRDALMTINFAGTPKTIVNADDNLEDVVNEVLTVIWAQLDGASS